MFRDKSKCEVSGNEMSWREVKQLKPAGASISSNEHDKRFRRCSGTEMIVRRSGSELVWDGDRFWFFIKSKNENKTKLKIKS